MARPNQRAASNRRPSRLSGGSGNLFTTLAADRAFPAAVAELGSLGGNIMGFYSSLSLVANVGVRAPAKEEVFQLFTDTRVLEPSRSQNEFYNLADDLIAFFTKHEAKMKNDRFFTPDTISFRMEIQILDPDGDYEAEGFMISIHGNGYFYPLTHNDFVPFLANPKLTALKTEVQHRFGGRFRQPILMGRKVLQRALIDSSGDWCWFGSQSL